MKKDWLVPLTGVAFVACLIAGFAIGGEPPDAGEPVQEIVDHYVDSKDSITVGAFLVGLAAVFLVFFANHLRTLFRGSPTSATVLAGAVIGAAGAGVDASLLVALAESADDIDPTAVQALQAYWDNDFVPMAIGIVVFLVSVGTSIMRTGVLPRWLGWIALVLALVGITPAGFIAFPGTGLLILVISVMLALRSRGSATAAPPAAQ